VGKKARRLTEGRGGSLRGQLSLRRAHASPFLIAKWETDWRAGNDKRAYELEV